ncbi:DUF222 domain-containing protein [Acidipropionibacterium jensenii]|uniref:DUF222 domain-containing protein n=1 Tax=Acidipropionibacterium jensenii TaxID=1749 RepID=UPI00214B8AA4|nr:DUF222 domain-containing protein [Acidipropionibacterium jensenii]
METEPLDDWAGGIAARSARKRLADAQIAVRRAEVEKIHAVLEMIDIWPIPEELDIGHPVAERHVPAGAAGAGEVGQFVTLEVAAALGVSEPAAWMLVHGAANLRSRHPLMWQQVQDLQVEVWQARRIVTACRELSLEAALEVDRKLSRHWGSGLGFGMIEKRARGYIVTADKALALRKARAAHDERYVSIRHNGDSTSMVIARIATAAALHLEDSLGRLADHLIAEGAQEALPFLRARALEMIATPYLPEGAGGLSTASPAPMLPLADVMVHISAEDLDPTTWAGNLAQVATRGGDVGSVLLPQLADLLGHFRIRVVPVIDLNQDLTFDGYQIPTRMRMQMQLREDTSVFPYSSRRSWACDLDHTEPFRPGSPAPPGQTRTSNLGPLSRSEHRAKTNGAWTVEQPAQGLYLWTSPTGMRFAVVNGHTHRLPGQ